MFFKCSLAVFSVFFEGVRYLDVKDLLAVMDPNAIWSFFFLKGIRKGLAKGQLVSYSFPVSSFNTDTLDFPYVDVVKYGLGYLDSISLMGAQSKTIQSVLDLGVSPSKVTCLSKFCAFFDCTHSTV